MKILEFKVHGSLQREWRSNLTALLAACFHAESFLGLFFYPEDEGEMFLRNVNCLSKDHMALYPRRQTSSYFH
jgi:hypothetical protein